MAHLIGTFSSTCINKATKAAIKNLFAIHYQSVDHSVVHNDPNDAVCHGTLYRHPASFLPKFLVV